MRRFAGWSALSALCIACAAAEESGAEPRGELGVLREALSETFSGTVAQDQVVRRGPFEVQTGSDLRVVLSGNGDADLYVRFGSRPTLTDYDCRPYEDDASEECVLTVPDNATDAFIDVRGYTSASYSLRVEHVARGSGGSTGGGGSGDGPSDGAFVIAVLGSSTPEGEGASSLANSWVGLLQSRLESVGDVSVVDLAVGGWAASDLLPGSGSPGNIDDALDEQPDLIVVAIAGSNDIDRGATTSTYLSNLTQVRDTASAAGVPTFFMGTLPKNMSDSERQLLADWNDVMRERFSTCWVPTDETYSPCFVDVFADLANEDLGVDPRYLASDGFHHNNAGHRVIFEDAIDVIEPYVCSLTECR
jgi:lysophospholipase L1-like esterase